MYRREESDGTVSIPPDQTSAAGGRLLGIMLLLIFGLLLCAVAIGIGLGMVFDAIWPATRGVLAGVIPIHPAIDGTAVPPVPSISELIIGLVPTNPVAAANNGTMASIVVFAIIFGFAVSRTSKSGDEGVSRVVRDLANAMIWIVHWVLRFKHVCRQRRPQPPPDREELETWYLPIDVEG
jgi:Na+/H+-dicarboxylate symporter